MFDSHYLGFTMKAFFYYIRGHSSKTFGQKWGGGVNQCGRPQISRRGGDINRMFIFVVGYRRD